MQDLNQYRITKLENQMESLNDMKRDIAEIKAILKGEENKQSIAEIKAVLAEKEKSRSKVWQIIIPILAAIAGASVREIIIFMLHQMK